jgi:hypothetical protein
LITGRTKTTLDSIYNYNDQNITVSFCRFKLCNTIDKALDHKVWKSFNKKKILGNTIFIKEIDDNTNISVEIKNDEIVNYISQNVLATSSDDVWYHGRTSTSDAFDLSYVGRKEAKDQEGPGFYFTSDKGEASGYAYPSGIILTVKLSPRKLASNTEPANIKDVNYLIENAPDKENTLLNFDENINIACKPLKIFGMTFTVMNLESI